MSVQPHGSSIPGTLEGAPFHNDNFMLSFNSEANSNGVLVAIGYAVTLATDNDFTVAVTNDHDYFLLGIAQTSGQLQSAIDVICRGVVDAYVSETVTAGATLWPSSAAGGDGLLQHASAGALPSRCFSLQAATVVSAPVQVLVLLF